MTSVTMRTNRRAREFCNRAGAPQNTDKSAAPRMDWGFEKGELPRTFRRIRTIAQLSGETAVIEAPAARKAHSPVMAPVLYSAGAAPISGTSAPPYKEQS